MTRIVVAKPTHRRWRDVLRGSFVSDLVRSRLRLSRAPVSGTSVQVGDGEHDGLPILGRAVRQRVREADQQESANAERNRNARP